MNSVWTGIGLRLAATGLFAIMSLFVRMASLEAPVGQIMFWRSSVAIVPIVLYLMWRHEFPRALRTKRPWGHLKRSTFGGVSMFLSFVSLAYLPLALATALGFLAPLVVIPVAIIVLRENPGWLVTGATVAGFAGVFLILWPMISTPGLDHETMIGIGAGIAFAITTAFAKTQIKALTTTEPSGTIAFYFALVCSIGGLLTIPFGWAPVSSGNLVWLIGAGLTGGLAHIAMTEALARAPVSTLSAFEYTAMIWAIALDLLVFGVLPAPVSLMGAVLIVLAAALVMFNDRLVDLAKRQLAKTAPALDAGPLSDAPPTAPAKTPAE
ncbi:DMT family transporter [Thalassospira sp. GO-4]|jgi:drug/metabolite transporter (DMT)-like permease|uniref:DMT family transporter n=1 Tax=Thalassospira sp. GO-4 TaxID=2946605 RepID=UPI002024FA07|nr:DMT family transporter [Thalassospira sp. GO-4]URK17285.1 DMT family transporter [Thalassospira sp. GO-4]